MPTVQARAAVQSITLEAETTGRQIEIRMVHNLIRVTMILGRDQVGNRMLQTTITLHLPVEGGRTVPIRLYRHA